MTDFDKLWSDYARYLPAVNGTYARFGAQRMTSEMKARLPVRTRPADLDFLNSRSNLTYWPHLLYSAMFGVDDKEQPTIVSRRDRKTSFVFGDSGGYAVIGGSLQYSQASFRQAVLEWQERDCDVGVILDVPTRALMIPKSGYTSLQECLDRTIANLRWALDHRSSSSLKLLNVMQGRSHQEARFWLQKVAPYKADGLAIAGDTRLDMWFWLARFREMLDNHEFDHIRHIHFLGTSQPAFAVLATALQRAMRQHVRPDISVTFDSSLAFRVAQQFGQFTTGLSLGRDGFKLTSQKLARKGGLVNRNAPFPFSSPIGDRCTVGHFLPGQDSQCAALDETGVQLLSNHAVYAELSAILQANRLVDMGHDGPNSPVPWSVRAGVEAVHEIIAGTKFDVVLKKSKQFLNCISADEPDRLVNADGKLQ